MRRFLFLIVLIPILGSAAAGQGKGFGLGFILGEPTGLSFKHWLSGTNAIDGGAAWSFGDKGYLHLHADYLFHKYDLVQVQKGRLPLYFGVGGRIGFATSTRVGVRGVVGLNYQFHDAPLDAFLELAPILDLVPATRFTLNGGIGMRFFF